MFKSASICCFMFVFVYCVYYDLVFYSLDCFFLKMKVEFIGMAFALIFVLLSFRGRMFQI